MVNHPTPPNIRKPYHTSSAQHTVTNAWPHVMAIQIAKVLAELTTLAVLRTQQESIPPVLRVWLQQLSLLVLLAEQPALSTLGLGVLSRLQLPLQPHLHPRVVPKLL
jgi:hypothetical protein